MPVTFPGESPEYRAARGPGSILDAIAQTVEQSELDEAFHRVADERWAKILATGKTVPWDDTKAWLEARSRGERPRKPVARKQRR